MKRNLMIGLLLAGLFAGPALLLAQDAAPEGKVAPAHAELLAAVDDLAKAVEKARGLEFKHPFERKVVTPAEVKKITLDMIEEEFPPEEMDKINALFARMGYMHAEKDLMECFGLFMEAGAAGMYDPEKKVLYLVDGASIDGAKPVIFHELVHALEDQHFDLGDVEERFEGNGDGALAYRALFEGSAAWLQQRFEAEHPDLAKAMQADTMKKAALQVKMLNEVPVSLTASMGIFPYTNAPAFVRAVAKEPMKCAELYENLPVSTEQVLHREKYLVDYPYEIALADVTDVLPEGWKAEMPDVVGELMTGLLLNELLGGQPMFKFMRIMNMADQSLGFKEPVKSAAEGWDGDRTMGYFGPDGQVAFVWASRWDTEKDAEEFAKAYEAGLPYKWRELGLAVKTAKVERRGDRVMIADGFPEEVMEDVMAKAWAKTTFKPDARDKKDVEAATPK
jgi:hypothetical protein